MTRRRHAAGIQELTVARTFAVPVSLNEDRESRNPQLSTLNLNYTVTVIPGVSRVDVRTDLENRAGDHRLRLLFPTAGEEGALAATTFGVATRTAGPRAVPSWVHPAPRTFPSQGWVAANGLGVGAPGLPEAELTEAGEIAITLLRSVGWLARMDLRSRPVPAGPGLRTPGAQCLGTSHARIALFAAYDDPGGIARQASEAELGLRAVYAGDEPLLPAGKDLLTLEGTGIVFSALKPAENGTGIILRVLNVTGSPQVATITANWPWSRVAAVRLDESPLPADGLSTDANRVEATVPAWATQTLLFAE